MCACVREWETPEELSEAIEFTRSVDGDVSVLVIGLTDYLKGDWLEKSVVMKRSMTAVELFLDPVINSVLHHKLLMVILTLNLSQLIQINYLFFP